jgi:aldehyde dehydrogenase (NAD+)
MHFFDEREAEIKQALFQDLGKPSMEAFIAEIAITKKEIAYACKNLNSWMQPVSVSTLFVAKPGSSHIQSEPLGVVLIISPWNYPVQLALGPLVGAIAAGNCAVIKPSEFAPATSKLLATLLPQYIDKACVQIVEGAIEESTALLDERFDHIFFTGSHAVGKIVMAAAAKHVTPVTLELGGKSPCIVDRDSNIQAAAERILWGKFSNAGQTCIAPDYLLVHEEIEEKLLHQMKKQLRTFYSDEPKKSKDYGRIVNKAHYQRLMNLINQSGSVFVGGEGDEDERYIAPTILHNVSADAPIMNENMEIFGPILPVLKIKSMEDAVHFINQRPKPLTLYLFSDDKKVQTYVEENTSSGSLVINHTLLQVGIPALPFGGVGSSGMGSYHGKQSFDTLSHRKSVFIKPNAGLIDPTKMLYPPYNETQKSILTKIL